MITGKALASLLTRAYIVEFSEEEVISETLLQVSEDRFWDGLFRILRECEIHRIMIEEIITSLQFDIKDFREYSMKTVSIKTYEFNEEFLSKMLQEILKLEIWAVNYYSQLLKLNYSAISQEYGEDVVAKIKDTLQKLVSWEKRHVKVVQDLQNIL